MLIFKPSIRKYYTITYIIYTVYIYFICIYVIEIEIVFYKLKYDILIIFPFHSDFNFQHNTGCIPASSPAP